MRRTLLSALLASLLTATMVATASGPPEGSPVAIDGLPAAAQFTPAFSGAGRDSEPLVYSGTTPCVLFDTRPSDLKQDESATYGTAFAFDNTTQGGDADCGIPPDARAALINLIALEPDGGGNLRISDTGVVASGGVVNYSKQAPNLNNSNAIIVDTLADPVDKAIDVFVNGQPVHVRGVLLGWLSPLLEDVIHVSASGSSLGDGDALRAVVEGATAGVEIRLGPGVYSLGAEPLVVDTAVTIVGSGSDQTTVFCACGGAVLAANEVSMVQISAVGTVRLVDLELENSATPGLPHVAGVLATGSSTNLDMERVRVFAGSPHPASHATAVWIDGADADIRDSVLRAQSTSGPGATTHARALRGTDTTLEVDRSTLSALVFASGDHDANAFAVDLFDAGVNPASFRGSTISASGTTTTGTRFASAFILAGESIVEVQDSEVHGAGDGGVFLSGASARLRVATSKVLFVDPVVTGGAFLTCVYTFDLAFAPLGASCA